MATAKPPAQNREYIETGAEPEVYVTETRYEAAGNGNIRRFAYVLRDNAFHLVHTEIIPIAALILMGRKAMVATTEAHNMSQWMTDNLTEQ